MRPNTSDEAVKKVTNLTKSRGPTVHLSRGSWVTIVGVVDDKTKLLDINIEISEGVDKTITVTESYKLVNRKFYPEDPVTPVGSTHISPGTMTVMVNPYAIESLDQLSETAYAVKRAGATFLHDGAYKPRTPPYFFQGLEREGLKYVKAAREVAGLSVIYEVTSAHATEPAAKYVDMLQIGARNMQNFEPLKEADKPGIPVSLGHGLCATTDEWFNAAEYITPEGNPNVILCERDTRTYEASTKNTLDVGTVPVIRQKSHLPIIVDPSHAMDIRAYMESLAKTVTTAGAGDLMIEVHSCPAKALSGGPQPPTFDTFEQLMKDLVLYAKPSERTFKAQ